MSNTTLNSFPKPATPSFQYPLAEEQIHLPRQGEPPACGTYSPPPPYWLLG